MIHNNMRKMMRKLLGVSGTSIKGWTDITGYTSTDSDTTTDSSTFLIIKSVNVAWSNKKFSELLNVNSGSTNYEGLPFVGLGHSVERNEPDYYFGEVLMPDTVVQTTTTTKTNSLIISAVLTNQGSEDIEFDEIGLFTHTWGGTWNGQSGQKINFILIKEVLAEPVKLRAGESISVAFNLFGDVTISEA